MADHFLPGLAILRPDESSGGLTHNVHFQNAVIAHQVFPKYAKPIARDIYRALLTQFPHLANPVAITRFGPDFVIQLDNPGEQQIVTSSRILRSPEGCVTLSPWSDQYGAQLVDWKTKVTVDIAGIPPHAFVRDTLAPLLEPHCSIQTCRFHKGRGICRVDAFALSVESIPKTLQLAIQIPIEQGVRNKVFPIMLQTYPYNKAPYLEADESMLPLNRRGDADYADPEEGYDSDVIRDALEQRLEDERQLGMRPVDNGSDSDYDSEGNYLRGYLHDSDYSLGSDYSGPYS